MIPRIIHYCWFGKGPLPQLALDCIDSWKKAMPEWVIMRWDESSFDYRSNQYAMEAYESGKYAFVSDYARLWALKTYGGIYLDVDFKVYSSFEPFLDNEAFAGFEGSKHTPVMMGVLGSQPDGAWVSEQLSYYRDRHFISPDGKPDLETNVSFLTRKMTEKGLVCNGKEQDFNELHIYPVEYFCPRQTTGEYFRTEKTVCEHMDLNSWGDKKERPLLLRIAGPKISIYLIKMKRFLIG